MSNQPAPEYVPRPSSSTGATVAVVVALILLGVLACSLGLLGMGYWALRTVTVPLQQDIPAVVEDAAEAPAPVAPSEEPPQPETATPPATQQQQQD